MSPCLVKLLGLIASITVFLSLPGYAVHLLLQFAHRPDIHLQYCIKIINKTHAMIETVHLVHTRFFASITAYKGCSGQQMAGAFPPWQSFANCAAYI